MKSVVLLLLVAIQIASAQYSFTKPKQPFTYAANLQAAVQQAQAEGKPIMVFVHLTRCTACKNLSNDLPKSTDIQRLSKQYVIVHSLDGSDKQLDIFGPSKHRYFPRIFFARSTGTVIEGVTNKRQPDYPYYYSNANELATSMRQVLNSGQY